MFSFCAIILAATSFGQFIDRLSTRSLPLDLDIQAQIALCCTNDPASIEIIGRGPSDEWRSLHVPIDVRDAARLRAGDVIRIRGFVSFCKQENGERLPSATFSVTNVLRLGREPFPKARQTSGGEISIGRHLRSVASVRGVLASAVRDESNPQLIWISVRTKTGNVRALASDTDFPLQTLHAMTDAEVELTGLCDVAWLWRRFVGHYLLLFGPEGLRTLSPPPATPFACTRMGSDHSSLHREQTTGTVIGIGSRDVFIRQDEGAFLPVTLESGAKAPPVGTHVAVAGFVEPDQNNMRLVEAVARPTGKPAAAPEEPHELPVAQLSGRQNADRQMKADLYGRIVRFRGTLNDPGLPASEATSLTVRCGTLTIPLDVAATHGSLDRRLCGSCEVEVCGICSVLFEKDPAGAAFPEFKGIIVIPRTGDDIRILGLPPWWTPVRFVWAFGILLALLSAILVWNAALRRAVVRKSAALLKEQVAKLEETLKIDERTRLAAELHDYLAQNLTVVSYRLSAALSAFRKKRDDTADYLESADRMLRSCRVDLRRCLWDLRNDSQDEPDFGRAIVKSVTPVSGKAAVHVRFAVRRAKLSDTTAHAILSICRELVANAVLHGKATTIRIAGEVKDGAICFSVRDDGCGFDPSTRPGQEQGHFGLDGLVERIKRLGGTFTIDSAPGRGTRAAVTVSNGGTI